MDADSAILNTTVYSDYFSYVKCIHGSGVSKLFYTGIDNKHMGERQKL
jgi:hypothetical protein